jgi:hypothetical protein
MKPTELHPKRYAGARAASMLAKSGKGELSAAPHADISGGA